MKLINFTQFDAKRSKRGLSISELCRLAKVDRTTFHRWQRGAMLSTRTLQKLLSIVEGK